MLLLLYLIDKERASAHLSLVCVRVVRNDPESLSRRPSRPGSHPYPKPRLNIDQVFTSYPKFFFAYMAITLVAAVIVNKLFLQNKKVGEIAGSVTKSITGMFA